MDSNDVTYPPLDTLKPVADRLWIVDSGPLKAMGMIPLPVRMTVVQLADGSLLLHSPTRYDAGLQRELEALGPIRHLVAPSISHWTLVQAWQEHLPGATTWAAPGLRERGQVKRSSLRIDHDLGAGAPEPWSGVLDRIEVPGIGGFCEICFFHRDSRTLILTDLVQNMEPDKLPRLFRPFAALAGATAPNGRAPAYLRAIIRLKGEPARQAGRRLMALEPERVIFAHGRWFERDAAARLKRSLAWLTG